MEIEVKISYKNDNLQRLRQAAGLSQSQLASKAGVNTRMLQFYEQGSKDINNAKLSTLLKICAVLNCRLSDILTDKETLELLDKYEEK